MNQCFPVIPLYFHKWYLNVFSLVKYVVHTCLRFSGATHADKSAVEDLSTSTDLTALTKRH